MSVSGVGSSGAAELAPLQRQLREDQLALQKAMLDGADQTTITADQLKVQTDQLAIATAENASQLATTRTASTADPASPDAPATAASGDALDLEASSSSTFQIDA